jgi:hypothetical protein
MAPHATLKGRCRTVRIMPKKSAAPPGPRPINRKPAKRALEAITTPTEIAAASPEKAVRENEEARWNEFYRNRWERRRKQLPNLKLKYPDDSEQECIAQLAGIKNTPRFTEGVRSIILDAHLSNLDLQTLSVSDVKKIINNVAERAEQLKKILAQLDVGSGSEGSHSEAGHLLERELFASRSPIMQLPEYIVLLDALTTAANRSASKRISYPRGAGGNPAFDMCIEQLVIVARMHGGSWTNYRSEAQIWTGTLLKGLELLKKYLPQPNFFPPGDLGRSVEHIRKKLQEHISRFQG